MKHVSSSVKESLVYQTLHHNLLVRDEELALLRDGIDRVQGLSSADLEGSDDELFSEEAQESETIGEKDEDSNQLGLIMLNCSGSRLNKKPFVMLHEVENGCALRDNVVLVEKEVNSGVNQQITNKQRLCETRFSERVCNQVLKKQETIKSQSKKRSLSGTNLNYHNSFAVLSNDNIACLACDVGVDISSMFFDTVEIMKDLEIVRHALDKSKRVPILDPNSLVHVDEVAPKDDIPLLEWLENDSESEQFTVVQSKKKKNLKSQILLENSVKSILIRRSKRTTPSVYRGSGG
jgi:hypothetical protein